MSGHAVSRLIMTRKQVADRLGRSLATVRRLEGSLLHPRRDSRGVHHFKRDEVEALARDLAAERVPLTSTRRSSDDGWESERLDEAPCHTCVDLQEEVDSLNDQLDALRRAHEQEVEELQQESERAKAQLRDEMSELERIVNDFVSTMEALR
jgi:hypothetical protein